MILDLSAGYRNIWMNRIHPDTIYVDKRVEVRPTLVCDTCSLPFIDNVFDLVVFDPPHATLGVDSVMARYYTAMKAHEIKDLVKRTSIEAYRVTKKEGWMAFKWNDHDVKLDRMLDLMEGWEPLFGHTVAQNTKHRSNTYWCLLRKRGVGFDSSVERFLFQSNGINS